MKRDEVFPSKYLKAKGNGKPVTVTIKSAPYEPFKNPEGKERSKTVLYFVGASLKYRELGQRRGGRRDAATLAGPPGSNSAPRSRR